MSIHDGHRQRIKERFRSQGLDSFNELNALELLLFYCVPRSDTNPLAHRLLDHFGSFYAVLEACPEELEQVEGVGHNISTYLNLIHQSYRFYHDNKNKNVTVLSTVDAFGQYLAPKFIGRNNEMVYLLCLDAKYKLITCRLMGEGGINSAGVPVRRIVDVALKANASITVLAHNHPGGLAAPSSDDIHATKCVAEAFNNVDILLADHLVFADNEFVSIAESGYYNSGLGKLWR